MKRGKSFLSLSSSWLLSLLDIIERVCLQPWAIKGHRLGLKQDEPHKEAIVPQGQNDVCFRRCAGSSCLCICTAVTVHASFFLYTAAQWSVNLFSGSTFFYMFLWGCMFCAHGFDAALHFRSQLRMFPSTPHILSLINKVVAVQISRPYLMSTSTPGLGPILSPCFETDGYYYNKKVANYFSSGRQKQLTTGIMCWLKSIPVSMKGEKNSHFPLSQLACIHRSESRLTLTWPQLSLT